MNELSAVLELPRRLAIRLLHEAQTAGAAGFEALVLARQEPGRVLDITAPDVDGQRARQLAQLAAAGWQPWALFRYHGERQADPVAAEFVAASPAGAPLLLTASLATKGVLQLHAWVLRQDGVSESELRIRD